MKLPKVERTIHLEASASDLWSHIVNGELASLWMGGEMTIDPRLNGRVTLAAEGSPLVFGAVEEIVMGESIIWTWRTAQGEPTQVTLRIQPQDEGAVLTVTEEMLPYEIVIIPPVLG